MKKVLKNLLKVSLSLGLGVLIFWLAYRKMDTEQIFDILKRNVRYEYVGIAIAIGILSHFFRALRWKMQMDALGERKPSVTNTFCAVLVGYFANFLFPRAGEVARCGIITQYDKIPFTKVLGTMIAERAFDAVVMLLLTLAAFLIHMNLFADFIDNHLSLSLSSFQFALWALGILLIFILLFYLLKSKIENMFIYKKIAALAKDIFVGIKTSLKLEKLYLFFIYTVVLWLCYYLMIYLPIYSFDFTSHLTASDMFFVYVMGGLATVIPVQGAIGTFHFFVIVSLMMFGIGETEAGAFAIIVHGAQMFSYMFGGIVAMAALPIVNRK
jgi:uncharacterized protein (TIRG00374 family)